MTNPLYKDYDRRSRIKQGLSDGPALVTIFSVTPHVEYPPALPAGSCSYIDHHLICSTHKSVVTHNGNESLTHIMRLMVVVLVEKALPEDGLPKSIGH